MPQDSNSENPLEVPSILRKTADGPISDQLEAVVNYIDQLPKDFKEALSADLKYFEPAMLEVLRDLWTGLQKIRRNAALTQDELGIIGRPHDMLRELAGGLLEAAENERIPPELERFVKAQIAAPLEQVAANYLPSPAESVVADWAADVAEDLYSQDPGPPSSEGSGPSPGGG